MKDSSSEDSTEFTWEKSLKTAIHIGISLSEWEEMTPYELAVSVEAFLEIQEMKAQEAISLVWLGEYYHRLKKLPPLHEIMKKFQPKKREMSDEEMLAVVKRLNSQFGGKVIQPNEGR